MPDGSPNLAFVDSPNATDFKDNGVPQGAAIGGSLSILCNNEMSLLMT
jgi:hypothetical protein